MVERASRIGAQVRVASAPGGGYDSYARTFAQYLRKHIPGEPSIVVQNMPGAGGVVAGGAPAVEVRAWGAGFALPV